MKRTRFLDFVIEMFAFLGKISLGVLLILVIGYLFATRFY